MKIHIIAFEEYDDYKNTIHDDELTLFEGRSGSGKSTLIRAIIWCLYGGSTSGDRYEVIVKYNGLKIIRKSRPATLEVIDSTGKLHPGDDGQNKINRIFGIEDLFLLCCYMAQGDTPCPLFSPKNKERLYYLTKLAFRDSEDPMVIIDKIRERLKDCKKVSKDVTADYDMKKNHYDEEIKLKALCDDERTITDLNKKMRTLEHSIDELTAECAINRKHMATRSATSESLKESKTKKEMKKRELSDLNNNNYNDEFDIISNSKADIEARIENINMEISKLEINIQNNEENVEINKKVVRYNKLHDQLAKLEVNVNNINVSERELFELEDGWKKYKTALKVATDLQIDYNEAEITAKRRTLKTIIQNYHNQKIRCEYEKLKQQYDLINDITEEKIEQEIHICSTMKNSMDLLICPKCDSALRITKNKLVMDSNAIISSKEEVATKEEVVKTMRATMKKKDRLKDELKRYEKNGVPASELITISLDEFNKAEKKLKALEGLIFYDKPTMDLEIAQTLVKYSKAVSDLENINSWKENTLDYNIKIGKA